MALVAYDYDSGSEDEEDQTTINNDSVVINLISANGSTNPVNHEEHNSVTHSLFSSLPQSKYTTEIVEDQIEDFIPKSKSVKDRPKVKILIPSLSEFNDKDDDEPQAKKVKPSSKGSGLLGLLPPVKGTPLSTKSFVPDAVKNKHLLRKPSGANSLVPNTVRQKAEAKKKKMLEKMQKQEKVKVGSDIESDDDIEMPETFDDEMWEKVCGRPKPKQIVKEIEDPSPSVTVNIAPEPEKPYDGLDNQAFKELVGKSKRPIGNIKLIDINEEEILPEKDIWMTKSLTDPELAPKPQVEDPVDPTRRKKHHITYLAQQAKANEQELQNAWASSKNNRLMSRAKYGF